MLSLGNRVVFYSDANRLWALSSGEIKNVFPLSKLQIGEHSYQFPWKHFRKKTDMVQISLQVTSSFFSRSGEVCYAVMHKRKKLLIMYSRIISVLYERRYLFIEISTVTQPHDVNFELFTVCFHCCVFLSTHTVQQ